MKEQKARLIALLALALCGITVLAGCSASPSKSEEFVSTLAAPPSADGFQDKILEDGIVTDAEYRLAIEATRACIEHAGWGTGEPYVRPDGYSIDVPIQGKIQGPASMEEHEADGLAADKVHSLCERDYLIRIDMAYAKQHAPSPAEQNEERALLVECLKQAGVENVLVSDDLQTLTAKAEARLGEGGERMQPFSTCLTQHSRAFTQY